MLLHNNSFKGVFKISAEALNIEERVRLKILAQSVANLIESGRRRREIDRTSLILPKRMTDHIVEAYCFEH